MAISHINRVDVFATSGGSDPAVFSTAATSHTAGNLLVICVLTQGDGASLTITNTAGDTFSAAGAVVTNNPNRVWIYYTLSTLGHANDIVQVSVGNSLAAEFHEIAVLQFSTSNTWALDDNDGATGFGTTASTPGLTLSGTEGVIVAIAENDGQNQIAGSGYNLFIIDDPSGGAGEGYGCYEYKIISASEAPSMTCGNDNWRMKSALFRDTGGGGGGAVVLMGQAVM